jgi:hypothetical protein
MTSAPARITLEASIDAIHDLDLDTLAGEHYDVIHDVIAVECERDEVVITTCRTLERPSRPVYRIPRRYVEKIHGWPPADTAA